MAIIKPFCGIRPVREKVKQVASKPYDVLNTEEASSEARGNPLSFYHVIKPEIDFPPAIHPYSPEIYKKGKENIEQFLRDRFFFQDKQELLYIYQQTMHGRKQTGIVGASSVDDYYNGVIKKHELTRYDKEEDRRNHIRISNMNYEPVFLAYPDEPQIDKIINRLIQGEPEYDFSTDDGIVHTFWIIKSPATIQSLVSLFKKIPFTYIADGHHRTAAAAGVGREKREQNPNHSGKENYNFFLSVLFPASQLKIYDYNRMVKDMNGLSSSEFLKKISKHFIIEEKNTAHRPVREHDFGMYLEKKWYSLIAKEGTYHSSALISSLDVTILYEHILKTILNIVDLRTDKRIDFVGGIRGLEELERKVNSGEFKAAFALCPVNMKQLFAVADAGEIMPPKTTWFEPKLRSGLMVYNLQD